MEDPVVAHNDYLQIVLLNLFSQVPKLNHIDSLTSSYQKAAPNIRREIIIAAGKSGQGHWIKELKEDFDSGADNWVRTAILSALHTLPGDEARHWIKKISPTLGPLEKLVTKWTFKDPSMDLGEIKWI